MCGIVGYIGSRQAQQILLSGLKSLEYRGYDSSGIALILSNKNSVSIRKSPGKISALENIVKKKPLAGSIGIAHTRWATHGAPNQENAPPPRDALGPARMPAAPLGWRNALIPMGLRARVSGAYRRPQPLQLPRRAVAWDQGGRHRRSRNIMEDNALYGWLPEKS